MGKYNIMGRVSLFDLATGDIWRPGLINRIHRSLEIDFIGRGSKGGIEPDQKLGTTAFQFENLWVQKLFNENVEIDENSLIASPNAVLEGQTRSISNQSNFLLPNGGFTALLTNSDTTMKYKVAGSFASSSSDISLTGLTPGPSATHTCLVDYTRSADEEKTKTQGENRGYRSGEIIVDTMGATMSALVGTFQAFEVNGDIFVAYIESTTRLRWCFRGFFFDASGDPIPRQVLSDDDVITLLQLAWVFFDKDGTTVEVVYDYPPHTVTEPTSPTTGDYWFDVFNKVYKRYDGADFVASDKTLIGWLASDATETIGARSIDIFKPDILDHTMVMAKESDTVISTLNKPSFLRVGNFIVNPVISDFKWDAATDFAPATETENVALTDDFYFYLYISEKGEPIISDFSPFYRFGRKGFYHPYNTWRCLGMLWYDTSAIRSMAPFVSDQVESIQSIQYEYRDGGGGGSYSHGASGTTEGFLKYNPNETKQFRKGSIGINIGDNYQMMVPGTHRWHVYYTINKQNATWEHFPRRWEVYQDNIEDATFATIVGISYANNGFLQIFPAVDRRKYMAHHFMCESQQIDDPFSEFGLLIRAQDSILTVGFSRGPEFDTRRVTA